MGIHVERVDLPGIGFRDDVITSSGDRLGVLTFRDGHKEVAICKADDPDSTAASVTITALEASTLAELLGQATLLDHLVEISEAAPGIFTEQLSLPVDSKFIGGELGDTKARSKTGVSIVALVRGNQTFISPKPSQDLLSGDVLVAVGSRSGLDALSEILSNTR